MQLLIRLMLLSALLASMASILPARAQSPQPPLAQAQIQITGLEVQPSPVSQVVPKNTGTIVSPLLVRPDHTQGELPTLPADALFLAELRGPALSAPLPLSARPNEPFVIPPLPLAGLYSLENIRLVSGGQTLLQGNPDAVRIEVIDKVLETQVTSRPLTADEIQAAGIVIDQTNFHVVNFTVAFGLQDQKIKIDFPVIMPSKPQTNLTVGTPIVPVPQLSPTLPPDNLLPGLRLAFSTPNVSVSGFSLNVDDAEKALPGLVDPLPGVVIIPGNIAYLNQFFSVILKVSNVAPGYSNLEVRDLKGEIVLPNGTDQVADTADDPLRMARVADASGTPQVQPKIRPVTQAGPDGKLGTADDVTTLAPQQNADAEFLVEGRREGVHTVNIKITGTLYGLPGGPVGVHGQAVGVVEVRNPTFSLTLNHPATISAGEEYDFLVTVTNISDTPANFASLSLLPNSISGAELLSDQVVQFATIAGGDSATAKFRLKALKTGNVVATSLAASDTPGKFELRTAVGELGIPMSPNSLVLPPTTDNLPDALRQAGLELLNQAYAVASSPTTPKGLLPMSKDIVVEHASDLAAAGQRIQMTEPLLSVARDLALDFIGNNYTRINERFGADGSGAPSGTGAAKQAFAQQDYAGFDRLLRQSRRGANFIQALANIWASAVLTDSVLGFQANFAQAEVARPAHISAIVGSGNGPAPVVLNLTDPANLHLGVLSPGAAPVQEVPYGAFATLLNAAPKASQLAMIAVPQPGVHTVEVIGTDSGSFDLGLIVPEGNQLRHLTFANVPIQNGGRAHVVFTVGGTNNYVLALDQNGDGVADQQINPTVSELVVDNGPQPISAVQIFNNELHGPSRYGQLIGVLLSQEVTAASAQSGFKPEQITNYQVDNNQVEAVAIQPGGRVVLMLLRDGIGPFIPRNIKISGLLNRLGHAMQPASVTLPIKPTITADGGTISGTVRQADGTPVPFAQIGLVQYEMDINDDLYPVTISVKNADSAGHYAFDYVRAQTTIFQFIDPASGQSGLATTQVRYNGQHLDFDLVLLGTGTVAGHVLAADGHTPLAGAVIRVINPLKSEDQYGATSDANGAYIIGKVPVGNISIEAAHSASRSRALQAAIIPNAGATVVQDLILQPVTQTNSIGALTGQVFRADGVTPVSDIPIYTNRGGVAITDAAGVYHIAGLPAGPIVIRAIDQTLLQLATVATTVVSDQTVTANLLLVGGIGTVRGVVLEADDTPVPGLKIYGGPTVVQTDATGAFTMTNVPVGIVQITVVDEVHQRQATASVTLTHDGETVSVQVILPANGVLAGRIFNMVNGVKTPVAGLKIFALGPRSDKQFTGPDGSYRFENMPLGDYTISAFMPDFSDGNIARGKLVFKDETLQLDVVFKGKGNVTGIVYDDDGVTPVGARVGLTELRVKIGQLIPAENPTCMGSISVGDATIQLPQCEAVGVDYEVVRRNRRINSDGSTGKFQFNDVFVGDFTVEAASAFSPDAVAVSSKVPTPGATVPVTLSLQSTGVVSGTVLQPDGITPVGAGVIVQYDSSTLSNVRVQTDAQGHFIFPLVSPSGFMLTAQNAISGTVGQTSGSVQAGQTAVMPIRLLRLGSVKVLVNGANGPVAGANVTLAHGGFPATNRTGVTQADGTITFTGGDSISEGPFSVTAVQSGVRGFTSSAIPALPASGQVNVVVTLSNAAGGVQGQFLRSDGATPIPNAQVALETSNGTAYATTDANGSYVFDGVLTGSFTLSGLDPVTGRRGKAIGQLATNGQVVTLNMLPVPQGTVNGTVRRSTDNAPVVGAEVILTISGPLGGQVRASSGANGAFTLPGVSAGAFNLSASDPTGHFFGAANGTLTTEGQTVVADVTIQTPVTGRVEGHITKADGSPANAAQVTYNSTSPGVSSFGTTTTDNNGFYFFDDVPKGQVYVQAKPALGNDGGANTGQVAFAGDVAQVNIQFGGTGQVNGTVTTAAGVPVSGLRVVIARNTTAFPYYNADTLTDGSGYFAFSGVPVGDVSLTTNQPSTGLAGSAAGKINAPDATLNLTVTLAEAGTVKGRVLRADGTPAAKMALEIIRAGVSRFGSTADDGAFVFTDMKLGNYALTVTDPLGTGLAKATAAVTTQGQIVDLHDLRLDTAPPAVVVITPTNNAINVPVSQPIQVRFSEPVVTTTVNSTNLVVSNNSGPLTGAWTLNTDGTLASFAVANGKFRDFDHINLRIKTGITDLVGRALPAEVLSAFTTSDGTPPLISSRSPASGTQAVALNAVVRINYAEAIDPTKFANPTQPITVSLNGAPVAGRIDFILNNTVIVFTPNAPLTSNATYRVTLQPATDLFGNKQTSGDTFTFTTVDLIAPVIQNLTSSAGTTVRVGASTAIVATLEPAPDIAQVEFFVNGQSRAIAKTSPYSYVLPVNSTSGSQLVVSAKATDLSGNVSLGKAVTLTVQSDLAPVVTIITPTNGTVVRSGSQVELTVRASDDVGLNKFFFQTTGAVTTNSTQNAPANTLVYTPTFTVNIPANAAPGSAVVLQVSATDTANHPSLTQAVTVTVQDAVPPVVQFSAPANGAVVNPGAVVNVVVSASDTSKVASINLQASGAANLTTTVPISPARAIISVTVPVTVSFAATAKDHVVLLARATDSAGNIAQPISLTLSIRDLLSPLVRTSLPAGVTNIAPGQSIQVSVVATDEVGLSNIGLRTTGAMTTTQSRAVNPVKLTTTALFTVTTPLTVSAQSVFTLTGTATDASGNVGAAAPITLPVTVDQLPVVSISSPISGSLVNTGGQVTVTVHASDDGGVTKIELTTSGSITQTKSVTVTSATASYTATFSLAIPTNTPLGNLVLRASAVDNRQQRSASAPVVLTLVDATLPTVQITSPANNTSITPGTVVTVSVTAADNDGVAALDLQTSGAFTQQVQQAISPSRTSVAAKLAITVPPTVTANALVTVTVRASDSAGNRSQPTAVLLKVLDVVKPVVTLTAPDGVGQVRQGKAITVTVAATDNVGVTNLGFRTAGAFIQTGTKVINPAQPSATNSFVVQTPLTATVGSSFTILGTAQDAALNSGVSAAVSLTVAAPLANVTGLVTNASGQPVANAPVTVLAANGTFNTNTGADGYYQVANIAEGAVTVRAVDPATNLRGSGTGVVQTNDLQVTINVQISDAPQVAITAPLTGTTVFERATVPVTVTATSAVGIRNVQFLVNGSVVFTDTTAPYRFDLLVPVGVTSQMLGARAVDTEGNSRTATAVVIHVIPDTQTIVVGRVVDSNGNGVAGATVTTLNSAAPLVATTGPTGTFAMNNVPTTQGNIQVIARATVNGQPWQGKSAIVAPVPGGVTDMGVIVIRLLKVWDGGGDHVSWQNAANWNNDTLPSATDDVYIPITATVNLDTSTVAINSLTSDGALQIAGGTLSLAAASVINNAFTLNGILTGTGSITITGMTTINSGKFSGSGRTVAKGGLWIKNTLTLDGRTLDNGGVATWSGGNLLLSNSAVFNNLAGATFNAASSGSFVVTGAGVKGQFNNAGSFVVGGNASISMLTSFINTGSAVLSGGRLNPTGGGSSSGVMDIRSGATLELGSETYSFPAGSSVSGGGLFLVSTGTVTVSGSYNITGTTSASSAVLIFPTSATVRNWGSKLDLSGNATLNLSTGQPVTLTTVSLTNGPTLSSTSPITVTNGMTVSSGKLLGSGRTVVKGGLWIKNTLTLDGRTLDNVGVATWSGGNLLLSNSAIFNNLAGATFNVSLVGTATVTGAGVKGQFNNAGTFMLSGNGSSISMLTSFINTGSAVLSSGYLNLAGGGSSSGAIDLRPGTTLELSSEAYGFPVGSSVSGGGTFLVSNSTVVTVSGSYNITGTTSATSAVLNFTNSATVRNWGRKLDLGTGIPTVNINTGKPVTLTVVQLAGGAILNSTDAITVTNGMTVSGGTLGGSGRTVVKGGLLIKSGLTLDGRTLDNAGTASWTDQAINFKNGAVFNNLPGATFNLALSSNYNLSSNTGAPGQFNNAGSLVKRGSASSSIGIPFTNTGAITVSAGTLDFSGGYVQTAGVTTLNGGVIKSSTPLQILGGKFTGVGPVTGNLANSGLVQPGNPVGALSVSGNYAQTGSGMLHVEISSTVPISGFDQLNVTGAATLSGTLAISLTNGFQPSIGATFTVMTYGSHSGEFAQINGASIGNGTHFLVTYNNTNLVLQVVTDTVTATSLDNSTLWTETGVAQTAVLTQTTPEAQPVISTTTEILLHLYLPLVTNNAAEQDKASAPATAPDADTVTPQSVRLTAPIEGVVAAVLGYQLYLPVLIR